MLFVSSLLIITLAGIAQAQTPQGFRPNTSTQLDIIFNTTSVKTSRELLSKSVTASQPQIAIAANLVTLSDTYMFVMMDLDVPPAGGNSSRRVLLHAMNTGFKATTQKVSGATLLVSSSKGPASYIPPSPPPSDTIPHRYVQLLFQQPSSLKVSATVFQNTQARLNFDINAFMNSNGVSAPIAANFFMVDGKATGSANAAASGTGGSAKNTVQPFTGGVSRVAGRWSLAGLMGGLALLAM
jgi:phosphatidylethanolamine-binding protein (PEBP) family uncharacterized protein